MCVTLFSADGFPVRLGLKISFSLKFSFLIDFSFQFKFSPGQPCTQVGVTRLTSSEGTSVQFLEKTKTNTREIIILHMNLLLRILFYGMQL